MANGSIDDVCCAPISSAVLREDDARELAGLLKALADPVRLQLISILAAADSGEICACDLPALVDRSQPTVSHHLKILTETGLVDREQRGKWAWFRLRRHQLDALATLLSSDPDVAAHQTDRPRST